MQPISGSPDLASPAQVILLSGGLDSVVNVSMALEKGKVLLALTFDYGQRAAGREIEASRNVCAHYSIQHRVVHLPWLGQIAPSSLIRGTEEVPRMTEADLADAEKTRKSARLVWVPNRNGVFINVAASFAESLGVGLIVTGFNREEGETFPDNTSKFLDAVNAALEYSTLNRVRVISYTSGMDKKEIVQAGLQRRALFQEVWSCYLGREKMCGGCESCLRLKRAIAGTEAEAEVTARIRG